MQTILIQFRDNLYLFILLIIVIVILLLAFHKKIGISIKEISIKLKNAIVVSFKLNTPTKKDKEGIRLFKIKIKRSTISDINGNVNIEDVQIEDSKIGNIKGI